MKIRATKRQKARAIDLFLEFLREKGLKITQERLALIEWLFERSSDDHFSADSLLFDAQTNDIPVSRATIYRTLELLEEAGLVRGLLLDDKTKHYDLLFNEDKHDHLICGVCGKMIEVASAEVVEALKKIAKEHRFEASSHTLTVNGTCAECKKKNGGL